MNNTDNNLGQIEKLIDNAEPIDVCDSAYEQIFKDLQGGVIKNYGRRYSLYIFIQFDKSKIDDIKKWIKDEIATTVTSTFAQFEDTREFKKLRLEDPSFPGNLCKNFFLSYKGYCTLGFDLGRLNDIRSFPIFKRGMKGHWDYEYKLNNPRDAYWYNPPENWDVGKDEIHALILIAHNCLSELKDEANTIINKCETLGKVLACEAGYALRNESHKTIGPFGFVDGISQPLFLKHDYDSYRKEQGLDQWDPKASLSLILRKDPFGEPYGYGSYCVWQKLETNYGCFEQKVKGLSKKLGIDRERAGALVFGRFKDGTPLDLCDQPNQADRSASKNNFNYASDLYGSKCPVQAHIRKVNPREDKDEFGSPSSPEKRKRNRIFRASMTYFDEPTTQKTTKLNISQLCLNKLNYLDEISKQPWEDNIERISGLLFVCFQNDISNQFSRLQRRWADDRNFPRPSSDKKYLDPIIGHPATKGIEDEPAPQEWPKKCQDDENFVAYSFYGCVKDAGGEFFFVPSISSLKDLP